MTTTRRPAPPFSLRGIAVPAFGPGLLFSLGEGAVLPVVALSARDLGASVAGAALMVTLIGLGSWFFNLPASLVTLKFGEKWSIVGAAGAGALALTAAGLSPLLPGGIWLLAAAMVAVGMAESVFGLARQKYLTEAVPVEFRARALSTLGGVSRIGLFLGPFIGAGVIQLAGLSGAYWVGVAAMAGAAVMALTIPELVAGPGAAGFRGSAGSVGSAASAGSAAGPEPTLRSVAVSHGGVFLSVGAGILLLSALRASRQAVIPLWADHLGMDATQASLIYGLSGAIDMLVFYPAGRLMDRKGRLWVAIPSTVVMGLALMLVPLTSGFVSLMAVAMLIGFGNGISSGLIMTLGADFSPDRGRGQFLGLWRFISAAGSTGGPVLLSGVTAIASLSAGVMATGVLGFASALVFAVTIPRLRHRRNY